MLESMITKLRPTRAEIVDVASAVYDGTSCVMLSAESAVGINPPNVIATMAKIAVEAENNIDYHKRHLNTDFAILTDDTISHASVNTAFEINAKAIVVFTASGASAAMISRFRPNVPIVALTMNRRVMNKLSVQWGVIPKLCEMFYSTDEMFTYAQNVVKELGIAEKGDKIVITAGVPLGKYVGTNLMKVENIQ